MWETFVSNKDSEIFNIGLVWWFTMQMDKEEDYSYANTYLSNYSIEELKVILKEKLSNILFYHVFYKNKPIKPDYKLYLKCLTNIINTSEKELFPDLIINLGTILHEYLLNNIDKKNQNIKILLSASERVLKNLFMKGIIKNNDFQYRLYEYIKSIHVDSEQ